MELQKICEWFRKHCSTFNKSYKEEQFLQMDETDSFDALKNALTEAPVLKCADPDLEFQVTYDASDTGTCALLTQTDDRGCRPVAYTSKKFNKTEQNYSISEKEPFGIIQALKTWRSYLAGAKFTIMTNQHTLKYLDTQKPSSRKQARWVEFMQEFNY